MNEQLAEVVGAFIGDGCFSEFFDKSKKATCSQVLFTGSWDNDSSYYLDIIKPIIDKNFNSNSNPRLREDDKTVRYFIYCANFKDWIRTLGFLPGPKAGTVSIPNRIITNRALSRSCVKGIFNTDGSIYRRYSRKYGRHRKCYLNYAVIQFKMNSRRVIEQIKDILKRENIKCTKITQDNNAWVCRITSQQDIDNFIINFKINHKHHLERYAEIRTVT